MWKAQIPWFARRHTVVTFDPRGNGRSDRPMRRRGVRRRRVRRRRHRRARRQRRSSGPSSSACARAPGVCLAHGGDASRPRRRRRRHQPGTAPHAHLTRTVSGRRLRRRAARATTGGRWRTATTGCGTGGASPSSSSARCSPSHTPPSSTRTASEWALEIGPETMLAGWGAPADLARAIRHGRRRRLPAGALPGARDQRRPGHVPTARAQPSRRRADRWRAGRARRRRPPPPRPRPGEGQPGDRPLRAPCRWPATGLCVTSNDALTSFVVTRNGLSRQPRTNSVRMRIADFPWCVSEHDWAGRVR